MFQEEIPMLKYYSGLHAHNAVAEAGTTVSLTCILDDHTFSLTKSNVAWKGEA